VNIGECEGSKARPILAKIAAQHGLLEEAVGRAIVKYGGEKFWDVLKNRLEKKKYNVMTR
jgi:hypothetical protein